VGYAKKSVVGVKKLFADLNKNGITKGPFCVLIKNFGLSISLNIFRAWYMNC
jgi:hypothetical protein